MAHYYVNQNNNEDDNEDEYEDDNEFYIFEDDERNYDVEDFNETVGENSIYGKYLKDNTKTYLNYSRHRSWCSKSYFNFLCKSAMLLQIQKKPFDWNCCVSGDHRQQLALLGHHNFWSSNIHKDCHSYDKSIIITILLCGNRYSVYLPNEMWLKILSFMEV